MLPEECLAEVYSVFCLDLSSLLPTLTMERWCSLTDSVPGSGPSSDPSRQECMIKCASYCNSITLRILMSCLMMI